MFMHYTDSLVENCAMLNYIGGNTAGELNKCCQVLSLTTTDHWGFQQWTKRDGLKRTTPLKGFSNTLKNFPTTLPLC